MKTFITKVALIATLLVTCGTAQAAKWENSWKEIKGRDVIASFMYGGLASNTFYTIFYFDTGKICDSAFKGGMSCSNWNVNPVQATFFVKQCKKFSKNVPLCKYYGSKLGDNAVTALTAKKTDRGPYD